MQSVWPDWAIYWTLGNFLKPLATINLPTSPTLSGNFCKVVKFFNSTSEIIFGRLLQTFGDFLLVTLTLPHKCDLQKCTIHCSFGLTVEIYIRSFTLLPDFCGLLWTPSYNEFCKEIMLVSFLSTLIGRSFLGRQSDCLKPEKWDARYHPLHQRRKQYHKTNFSIA